MSKFRSTALAFWQAFSESQTPGSIAMNPIEAMRLRCLIGLTALEADLSDHFQSRFGLEWAETASYLKAMLNEPARLVPWIEATVSSFSRAQWMATLRFLSQVTTPKSFTPTFADFVVLESIVRSEPGVSEECRLLLRLNVLRDSILRPGRPTTELEMREALKLLEQAQKKWGDETAGPASPVTLPKVA